MKLEDFEYFFFDIERTLIRWKETIIGAEDLIHTLNDSEKKIRFHTDNSLLTRASMAQKLSSLGIPAKEEQILTSGYVAGGYLKRQGINEVYAIGEQGLHEELSEHNIDVRQSADAVIVGLDRQFTYSKLRKAAKIAEDGKFFICNSERDFQLDDETIPNQAPINNALATYGNPTLLGKPSKAYVDEMRNYYSFMPGRSLFIGDRIADIETGNKLGMKTALVMSGETDKSDLSGLEQSQKPDFGVSNLNRLTKKLRPR